MPPVSIIVQWVKPRQRSSITPYPIAPTAKTVPYSMVFCMILSVTIFLMVYLWLTVTGDFIHGGVRWYLIRLAMLVDTSSDKVAEQAFPPLSHRRRLWVSRSSKTLSAARTNFFAVKETMKPLSRRCNWRRTNGTGVKANCER